MPILFMFMFTVGVGCGFALDKWRERRRLRRIAKLFEELQKAQSSIYEYGEAYNKMCEEIAKQQEKINRDK